MQEHIGNTPDNFWYSESGSANRPNRYGSGECRGSRVTQICGRGGGTRLPEVALPCPGGRVRQPMQLFAILGFLAAFATMTGTIVAGYDWGVDRSMLLAFRVPGDP